MAGTSQKQTSRRTTAGTGQRSTTQKKTSSKRSSSGSKTKQAAGRSRSGSGRKSTSARQPSYTESFVSKEIGILALFAVCVLMFLSNIGLCGALGAALHSFLHGMFGFFGYIFPVYLFAAVLLYVSNQENGRMVAKVAVSACLFLVLCGIAALLTTKDFDKTITIAQYYGQSTAQAGGGVVGGLILMVLCPAIGTLGAYIVSILLLVAGIVFITERSVLQPIQRGSRKVYDTAREDMARRREIHAEKAEERRLYRLEQKVSGVALEPLASEIPTGVSVSADEPADEWEPAVEAEIVAEEPAQSQREKPVEKPSVTGREKKQEEVRSTDTGHRQSPARESMPAKEEGASGEKTAAKSEVVSPFKAERRPIRITGIGFEKEEPVGPEEPVRQERVDSPMIPSSEDILIVPKDTRTLAELEALDSLHSNIFSAVRNQAVWREPDEDTSRFGADTEEMLRRDLKKEEAMPYVESRQIEEQSIEKSSLYEDFQPAEEPLLYTDIQQPAKPSGQDCSQTGQASPAADTKLVVTANGKIMEVDVDPDDDPLTRKLLAKRISEQEAAGTKDDYAEGQKKPQAEETAGGWLETARMKEAGGGLQADKARETNGRRPDMRGMEPQKGGIQPPEDLQEWVEMTTQNPMFAGTSTPRTAPGMSAPGAASGAVAAGRASSQTAPGSSVSGASSGIPAQVQKKPPKPYVRPPYNLMKSGGKERKNSDRELRETARKLETTLQNFGVGVTVTNISCGPSVTRYEIQPEQGVRVSKIVGLSDDIKLNLAAADIRIEAPIPGKASVGIEVPNKENTTVFLRDVLESKEFDGHGSKLAFAVGRDISGDVVVTDLAKMPHLLIAGATGSGKSVCINTLIMSVLYKAKPEEVRLIMVDPKVVELSIYNGIPHLMIPVVTDPKKAAGALNWAVAEMTDRYRKFADWNVRDLKGYNEKIRAEAEKNGEKAEVLPQIVIIIDELADLMMVCPGDVEDAICRLAQMARAAGLHLVIATQRPSVNVITGLIKANVPSRIAFSVSSGVDSRTIIDMNGAEKLLGKGDMLFYPSGYQKPVRVQGAFVSDSEVSAVVDFLKENNEGQTFDSAVEARLASMNSEDTKGAGGGQGPERDEYFTEAGRFIIEKQKASIGMLQRVFKVGFNRAARIMDQLAEAGVVSEEAGTKAREILMDAKQYEELLSEMGLL